MTAARAIAEDSPLADLARRVHAAQTDSEAERAVAGWVASLPDGADADPAVAEKLEWANGFLREAVTRQRATLVVSARAPTGTAGESLLAWNTLTFPGYLEGWLHRELAAALERFSAEVAAGRSPRLIVEAPPRHGKSHLVSQRWPVWHMATNPGHEIVCASYGSDLANAHGLRARRLASEGAGREVWWPDWPKGLLEKVDHWELPNGSGYKPVGVGGAITGHGAHMLIIDDPIKNSEQAQSKSQRDKVWTWYTGDAYTRLAPGGGVLVMHTRWHEDDLVGRLLVEENRGGDQWRRVSFPAIAEADEAHRKAGEALHSDRYDIEKLKRIRAVLPPWQWAALYQQRPVPLTGGMFQREWATQFWHGDPKALDLEEVIVSADLTFKGGAGSDYVVMQAWGVQQARRYLLDQRRERIDYPTTRATLRAFVARWSPSSVLVEDKANGPALVADLKDTIPGLIPVNPGTKSKDERAQVGAVPAFQAGQVWLPTPERAPWVDEYVEELCAFPKAPHDDQVDATSQALLWLQQRGTRGMEENELAELAALFGRR